MDIPGLGEVRVKTLIRRFGSLKRLSIATVAEIRDVPGIGPALADVIYAALHGGELPE